MRASPLKQAVDMMRKYQKHVNITLSVGIACFHLTAMTFAWVMLSQVRAQCGGGHAGCVGADRRPARGRSCTNARRGARAAADDADATHQSTVVGGVRDTRRGSGRADRAEGVCRSARRRPSCFLTSRSPLPRSSVGHLARSRRSVVTTKQFNSPPAGPAH